MTADKIRSKRRPRSSTAPETNPIRPKNSSTARASSADWRAGTWASRSVVRPAFTETPVRIGRGRLFGAPPRSKSFWRRKKWGMNQPRTRLNRLCTVTQNHLWITCITGVATTTTAAAASAIREGENRERSRSNDVNRSKFWRLLIRRKSYPAAGDILTPFSTRWPTTRSSLSTTTTPFRATASTRNTEGPFLYCSGFKFVNFLRQIRFVKREGYSSPAPNQWRHHRVEARD